MPEKEADPEEPLKTPHLAPLLEYLSTTYDVPIAKEKARGEQETPSCTFKWLWLLFPPGSIVVTWTQGIPYAYRISSHSREERCDGTKSVTAPVLTSGGPSSFSKPRTALTLKMWSIDYDGKMMGRLKNTVIIQPFEGEKNIGALPVVPLTLWKDYQGISREALEARLLKRGQDFFKFTKRTYCEYHGKAVSWPNRVVSFLFA